MTNTDLKEFKDKHFGDSPNWRQPFEVTSINWSLLDNELDSPLGKPLASRACGLAVLYALVFFLPKGIGGCDPSKLTYVDGLDKADLAFIPRQRLGTHLQMALRELPDRPSIYFIALLAAGRG